MAVLVGALQRVSGMCGCADDASCYGCLRTYRNQFVHHELKRGPVFAYLSELVAALEEAGDPLHSGGEENEEEKAESVSIVSA